MTSTKSDPSDRASAVVEVIDDDSAPAGGSRPPRDAVGIGTRLARRLGGVGADGTETATLTTTAGRRTAAVVAESASVAPDGVQLSRTLADRLGVADGDRLIVERVDPVEADRLVVAPVANLSVAGGEDAVRSALSGRPVLPGDTFEVSLLGGSLEVPFSVVEASPDGVVLVGDDTIVETRAGPTADAERRGGPVPSTAVGGYEDTVETVERTLVRPLAADEAYRVGGRSAAAGVVVEGISGVGKTHHVRHAAHLADARLVGVDAARFVGGGQSVDDRLESVVEEAATAPRALVHLDGLDAFEAESDSDAVVGRLCEWIDRLRGRSATVVVGEATDASALPSPLTRGDRLSRRVSVPQPDAADRRSIFEVLTEGLRFGPDVDAGEVGERTRGYVAADLVGLRARLLEAAMDRAGGTARPTISGGDVETALAATAPGADVAGDVPDVSFDDVGGLAEAKRELVRAVEWPLRYPEELARLGIDAPGGVLLYGPPGTGKTLLARAVASDTDATFLSVKGPELFDKYVGESERAVRELFERARERTPAVVFFDELDALGATRTDEGGRAPERVVSQLLTELDGLDGRAGVTAIGATNRLDRIDPALVRPGRFDRTVEVGLPDREERREILEIHARDRPIRGVDFGSLAARTDGYSGSDLAAVLREASQLAFEAHLSRPAGQRAAEVVVTGSHVETALERVEPSVSDEG